jgi:voltage-gated potassium channel
MAREGIAIIFALLAAIVAGGTVFFHIVEGWGWLDAYFFTVVTISTVGYGNLVPATAAGKIATTALIFLGLGVFGAAIRQLTQLTYASRLAQRRKARKEVDQTAAESAPPGSDGDARPPGRGA